MGLLTTKEDILEEVSAYYSLPFHKKTKNLLVLLIIAICVFSLLFAGVSLAIYDVVLYLLLSVFIYLNHRWAIALFGVLITFDKIISLIVSYNFGHLLILLLALMFTYDAFRVATELKKNTVKM